MIIKKVPYLQEAIHIFKSRVEDLWPRFVMVDILRCRGRASSCMLFQQDGDYRGLTGG
jgi:hypothetical protein